MFSAFYVLHSQGDVKLYTGFTSDVTKGTTEHQNEYVHSTRHCGVLAAIYYEFCLNEDDAMGQFAREKSRSAFSPQTFRIRPVDAVIPHENLD